MICWTVLKKKKIAEQEIERTVTREKCKWHVLIKAVLSGGWFNEKHSSHPAITVMSFAACHYKRFQKEPVKKWTIFNSFLFFFVLTVPQSCDPNSGWVKQNGDKWLIFCFLFFVFWTTTTFWCWCCQRTLAIKEIWLIETSSSSPSCAFSFPGRRSVQQMCCWWAFITLEDKSHLLRAGEEGKPSERHWGFWTADGGAAQWVAGVLE